MASRGAATKQSELSLLCTIVRVINRVYHGTVCGNTDSAAGHFQDMYLSIYCSITRGLSGNMGYWYLSNHFLKRNTNKSIDTVEHVDYFQYGLARTSGLELLCGLLTTK